MKVILIQDVKSLGKIGDEVLTSRGYAVNYLLVKKLAIYSTEENKAFIKIQKETLRQKSDAKKHFFSQICTKIANSTIKIVMQASKEGKLFGSVNSKRIAEELSNTSKEKISHSNINLKEPLKQTGIYNVGVFFSDEIQTNIQLVIGESEKIIDKILLSIPKDSDKKLKNTKTQHITSEISTSMTTPKKNN